MDKVGIEQNVPGTNIHASAGKTTYAPEVLWRGEEVQSNAHAKICENSFPILPGPWWGVGWMDRGLTKYKIK